MWRSFFLAAGAYCCLFGLQCLTVDKLVLSSKEPVPQRFMGVSMPSMSSMNLMRNKEITPPDWAPWSLMSLGAVTLLYSVTLPGRNAGG
jgi:hypothetical protein